MRYFAVRDYNDTMQGIYRGSYGILSVRIQEITQAEFETYREFGIEVMGSNRVTDILTKELDMARMRDKDKHRLYYY